MLSNTALRMMMVFAIATMFMILVPTNGGAVKEHTVIAEYFSHSQCGDCHKANHRMSDVYYDSDLDFVYVTLVVNKVDLADERMNVYTPEDGPYPMVEFDGGYLEEEGLATIEDYENDVWYSAGRDVPEVLLELEMEPAGDGKVRVNVAAELDHEEALRMRLIAYIVEPRSRYRDSSDVRYAFGFLDMALEADIDLEPGVLWTNETVWVGSEHNDTKGNDFGDMDYDNVNVVVGVFLNRSGNPRYSFQAAIAVPPDLELLTPAGNATGQVDIRATATGNATRQRSISRMKYRVDHGPWHKMNLEGDEYHTTWNSTDVNNGTHVISVKAVDDTGTSNVRTMILNVSNDDFVPPSINILSPDGPSINGSIEVVINASDENELEVSLTIDGNDPIVLDGNATYSYLWNTTGWSEGQHVLKASAFDGAFTVTRKRALIVDNDLDPVIVSITPSNGTLVSGNITINVTVRDNEEVRIITVDQVSFSWHTTFETVPFTIENSMVTSYLHPNIDTTVIPDGNWTFLLSVNDSAGQVASADLVLEVDNTPPPTIVPSLDWDHGWFLEWDALTEPDVVSYNVYSSNEDFTSSSEADLAGTTNGTNISIADISNIRYLAVVALDGAGNEGVPTTILNGTPPRINVAISATNLPGRDRMNITVSVENRGSYFARGLSLSVTMGNESLFNGSIADIGPNAQRNFTFMWNVTGRTVGNATVIFEGYDITTSLPVNVEAERDDEFDPAPALIVLSIVLVLVLLIMLAMRISAFRH